LLVGVWLTVLAGTTDMPVGAAEFAGVAESLRFELSMMVVAAAAGGAAAHGVSAGSGRHRRTRLDA
jgi:hypothetical protein